MGRKQIRRISHPASDNARTLKSLQGNCSAADSGQAKEVESRLEKEIGSFPGGEVYNGYLANDSSVAPPCPHAPLSL